MRIPVEMESRVFPKTTKLHSLVFYPKLVGVNYGVKASSLYKYNLGAGSKCNRCGTSVTRLTANRTKGYSLTWDCQTCAYTLMQYHGNSIKHISSYYQIANNPVKWYVKLWWQFKVGVRRLFK